MPDIDLLNCPFCGGKAETFPLDKYDSYGNHERLWYSECGECFARSGYYNTEGESAIAWNTRIPGWIPCSERLPEDDEEVLFAVAYPWDKGKKPKVALGRHYTKDGKGWWTAYYGAFLDYEVTHWMPKPEPTKEV